MLVCGSDSINSYLQSNIIIFGVDQCVFTQGVRTAVYIATCCIKKLRISGQVSYWRQGATRTNFSTRGITTAEFLKTEFECFDRPFLVGWSSTWYCKKSIFPALRFDGPYHYITTAVAAATATAADLKHRLQRRDNTSSSTDTFCCIHL